MGVINFVNESEPFVSAENLNEIQKNNVYSTNEIKIGQWIDGKPIYKKVLEVPISAFNSNNVYVTHGISNLGIAIAQRAFWFDNQAMVWRMMPSVYYGSSDWSSQTTIKANEVFFELGNSVLARIQSKANVVYVIIEYTKTTD